VNHLLEDGVIIFPGSTSTLEFETPLTSGKGIPEFMFDNQKYSFGMRISESKDLPEDSNTIMWLRNYISIKDDIKMQYNINLDKDLEKEDIVKA